MATNVTFNGVVYSIPAEGDDGWGTTLSNLFIAIGSGALQKTGGTFTLTAETDFGATYGLKLPYIKSKTTNPGGAGFLRIGNAENITWRNAANSGDLSLTVNASDALQFNGANIISAGAGSIVNADIAAGAAIALSKLAVVTASRALVSDGSGVISASAVTATELGYLSGVTSAIQTQIDSKAASSALTTHIADVANPHTVTATQVGLGNVDNTSNATERAAVATLTNKTIDADLNTITNIENADIKASAAIAYSKLNLTGAILNADLAGSIAASKLVGTDIATVGTVTAGTWSADTIALNKGGTGQTTKAAAFDALSPMTTGGDLIYGGASGTGTRLANGTAGHVLTSAGGTSAPTWSAVTATAITAPLSIQKFTSGSGTYNKNYTFIITSGSATVGATYTNNAVTFTVYATVASATQVVMSGSGAPAASGTLTKASGTGDATLTFSQVLAPQYLKVKMVGGGGGGGASGTAGGGTATAGGNSTFGSELTANGGAIGSRGGAGGAGGTGSLGAIASAFTIAGGSGCGASYNANTTVQPSGGTGGNSVFGGGGGGGYVVGSAVGWAGIAGSTNSGGGGGGAGCGITNTTAAGSGGGAGAYIEAILTSPDATYAYAVGAAGSGASAGTNGAAGANGAAGVIIVEEHYQ